MLVPSGRLVMNAAPIAGLLASAAVHGAVLHVENYGVDSDTCGSQAQPCRSISRGIANANAGDTVLVGPGNYGDLNRDDNLDDPGDEARDLEGRGCGLCIDKSVRILSSHGAGATRIEIRTDRGGTFELFMELMVLVEADNVTFGAPDHGFSLTGGPFTLLAVQDASNVSIGGNVAYRTDPALPRDLEEPPNVGFSVSGREGTIRLTENVSVGHHFGFTIAGNTARVVLRNNAALGNSWNGFVISGSVGHRLIGNYANGNGEAIRRPSEPPIGGSLVFPPAAGFQIVAANVIAEDNISTGNFRAGFLIQRPPSGESGGHVFRNNAAIGNQGAGFLFTDGSASQPVRLRFNNIYGNLGVLGNPPDEDTTGCGLINQSGAQISAIRNFWGQASGPGEDPGDLAGPDSGCDRGEGSKTDVAEFLRRPAPVAP